MSELPTPLVRPVVDAHCHLDVRFDREHELANPAEALAQARAQGITKIIQVGCDVRSSKWAAEQAAVHPDIWATVAIHPNDAVRDPDLDASLKVITELAHLPQVRGIGETGLDYFRTKRQDAAAQHKSFRAHIQIAKDTNKALVIHDRDAHDDVVATLLEVGAPKVVVFHCFSGDVQLANIAAERGWYCSFAGNVTYKNATNLHTAAAIVPSDLLLVETDAPYLTPVPFRGQPNASTLVPLTVRFLAQLRSQDEAELCDHLYNNAERVFGPL